MSTQAVNPVTPAEPSAAPASASPPAVDATVRTDGASTPAAQSPDLRLIIEEDKASGSYVYKTVDVLTGKVVQQIPREEVLRLRDAAEYQPGAVVNARS